ncbi:hypothetical protein J4E91_002887 [Alternaria rosae]|nr:hypothetical protein J4E91_002887 [Alternaria rosae]
MSYGEFKKETDEKRKSVMKDYLEDVHKWSYIDTEDLVTPTHVLQLLNSRGRFTPNRFAETDWQSSELGRNISVIKARPIHDDPNDEGQYKDLFEAEDEGDEREGEIETEKRLREWKDRYKDSEWAYYMLMDRTSLEAYRIPMKIPVALEAVKPVRRASEALDVLQIQQPLMAFLVKICLELLPDVEISLERITVLFQAPEDLELLAAFSQAPEQPEPPRIGATKED